MRIKKKLNNNAVVTIDELGNEVIYTGVGIGWERKVGDPVDIEKAEKKFTIDNDEIRNKLQHILVDVPLEIFDLVDNIVSLLRGSYGLEVSDTLYVTLSDHLTMLLKRKEINLLIDNPMLFEIKNFYQKEFSIALDILDLVNATLECDFNEDEAGFITWHIITATTSLDFYNVHKSTRLMNAILNIIKYHFELNYDENSIYYQRFITHLKFFTIRVMNSEESTEKFNDLAEVIQEKYKEAYSCVEKISKFIEEEYSYKANQDEKIYLTLHVQRILDKE
ncbi:PRD domain-containing protein [Vagococcus xieshaowenii]|uniref:PRD domain-containing protein n=1 Tax=Vagococcus xieshaowenii TaxID=2562451 RepID=A0AAJ5EH08_9ENTE|nr:PRD domain-containing protein [Vagococcus xieshaowenii]QCA28880.1 PRD domain-containing protein [Vagococcus xieshaowenii]TFZ43298.1 PRD domain-containing protein [Vagococcus xieshaowenii]